MASKNLGTIVLAGVGLICAALILYQWAQLRKFRQENGRFYEKQVIEGRQARQTVSRPPPFRQRQPTAIPANAEFTEDLTNQILSQFMAQQSSDELSNLLGAPLLATNSADLSRALAALGNFGITNYSPAITETFVQVLENRDLEAGTRVFALNTISVLVHNNPVNTKAAVLALPHIIQALSDPDESVRLRAAKHLGEWGSLAIAQTKDALPFLQHLSILGTNADNLAASEAIVKIQ